MTREANLMVRAEAVDDELTKAAIRQREKQPKGKGQTCDRCRQRPGERIAGYTLSDAWRCGTDDTTGCPAPPPIVIAAEIDPTERDPRRRWLTTRSNYSDTIGLNRLNRRHGLDPEETSA